MLAALVVRFIGTPKIEGAGVQGLDVSSPFGPRVDPHGLGLRMHWGIDLPVPEGTTVVAPEAGTVFRVDLGHRYNGNAVFIRGFSGWEYRLLHLAVPLVVPSQVVQMGQPVGYSGSTGKSTGPHLHFETLDPYGRRVDPVSIYPRGTYG